MAVRGEGSGTRVDGIAATRDASRAVDGGGGGGDEVGEELIAILGVRVT